MLDKRQRFAWRMVRAAVFAFLSVGNAFCLYLMAKAVALGHLTDTTAAEALFWIGLVVVAILFMCSLHEFIEALGEIQKKEDKSCAR